MKSRCSLSQLSILGSWGSLPGLKEYNNKTANPTECFYVRETVMCTLSINSAFTKDL